MLLFKSTIALPSLTLFLTVLLTSSVKAEKCSSLTKRGSRGDCVKLIQRTVDTEDDGIFGAGTETAVKEYQRMKGLGADGLVGTNTWNAIYGPICTWKQAAKSVSCGKYQCTTVDDVTHVPDGKLPVGQYLIGQYFLMHGTAQAYKLYKPRPAGGYWDYHTKVPEVDCQGGFGLHKGSTSWGCITVPDNSCWAGIKRTLDRFPLTSIKANECLSCVSAFGSGSCLLGSGGTVTVQYRGKVDIQN